MGGASSFTEKNSQIFKPRRTKIIQKGHKIVGIFIDLPPPPRGWHIMRQRSDFALLLNLFLDRKT